MYYKFEVFFVCLLYVFVRFIYELFCVLGGCLGRVWLEICLWGCV